VVDIHFSVNEKRKRDKREIDREGKDKRTNTGGNISD
jgi:hypothetical protein